MFVPLPRLYECGSVRICDCDWDEEGFEEGLERCALKHLRFHVLHTRLTKMKLQTPTDPTLTRLVSRCVLPLSLHPLRQEA